MSWLLKSDFKDEAGLKRVIQVSRAGVGTVYASAALPLAVGDAFVLEADIPSDGVQRWGTGVVRARGTGVLTLQLPDARHFLRRERGYAVLARRSQRFWAGLRVQVLAQGGRQFTCELLELSADGARLRGDCGAAGQEVGLALQLGAMLFPLAQARVCWRTPQQAGLRLVNSGAHLPQLLRVLASRWKMALPLLAPGVAAPPLLPPRPALLEERLGIELAPRPQPAAEPTTERSGSRVAGLGRLVMGS